MQRINKSVSDSQLITLHQKVVQGNEAAIMVQKKSTGCIICYNMGKMRAPDRKVAFLRVMEVVW